MWTHVGLSWLAGQEGVQATLTFNRTVRYEWLSQYYWRDLAEVQDFATKWMWSYNHDRPNMALGGFTPKQRLAMAA